MRRASETERFRRLAFQRLEESEFLLNAGYTTAAMYLSGYAVECILKALILSSHLVRTHRRIVDDFRGERGHNYDSLRARFLPTLVPPKSIARALASVRTWSTNLRYEPRRQRNEDARRFINSVKTILDWCEERIA